MGVDEEHRRVLADDLELAVGLGLGPGEPVAVHVEAVDVAPLADLAAVGVLGRQDHDEGVGDDLVDDAVVARGELVQGMERGVGAALLAAVDVAGDPQDHRRAAAAAETSAGLASGFIRTAMSSLTDWRSDEPVRIADDRVVDRPGPGRSGPPAATTTRSLASVDGGEVVVDVGDRHLGLAEVEVEHVRRGRHVLAVVRLGVERVASRRSGDRRGRPDAEGEDDRPGPERGIDVTRRSPSSREGQLRNGEVRRGAGARRRLPARPWLARATPRSRPRRSPS